MKKQCYGLLLVGPSLVVLFGLVLYPLAYCLWLSLWERQILGGRARFVGLAHYLALAGSPTFWEAFRNGVVFAGSSVTLQVLVGTGLALLLNRSFRGRTVLRGAILLPFIVPTVVAVLVWKWILNDLYGIMNHWLLALGAVRSPVQWLSTPGLAMATVVGINVWLFFPFVVIMVLARLQVIPMELYEAARVDGAGGWRQFFHVTFPQIRAVLFVVILVRGLWMFNKFDSVWLVTEGGPLGATEHLPILTYLEAFGQLNLGRGAAIATLLFLFLAVVSLVYFRAFRPAEEEL